MYYSSRKGKLTLKKYVKVFLLLYKEIWLNSPISLDWVLSTEIGKENGSTYFTAKTLSNYI